MLYPVFDPPVDIDNETTGEFLAASFEALDAIAERLGLVPLTAFVDNRAIPEDFDGDPDELDELMGPCSDWFDASAGQAALTALADAMSSKPGEFEDLETHRAAVAEELRDLAQLLGQAAAGGARFRLELS